MDTKATGVTADMAREAGLAMLKKIEDEWDRPNELFAIIAESENGVITKVILELLDDDEDESVAEKATYFVRSVARKNLSQNVYLTPDIIGFVGVQESWALPMEASPEKFKKYSDPNSLDKISDDEETKEIRSALFAFTDGTDFALIQARGEEPREGSTAPGETNAFLSWCARSIKKMQNQTAPATEAARHIYGLDEGPSVEDAMKSLGSLGNAGDIMEFLHAIISEEIKGDGGEASHD